MEDLTPFVTPLFHYKLTMSYNGSGYQGFQSQRGGPWPTIQGELEKALAKLAKSSNIRTLGSGRTDAAAHALGQVAKVSMPLELLPDQLQAGLASLLPGEIEIIQAERSSVEFHPIKDVLWKEYWYFFSPGLRSHPFAGNLVGLFPFDLDVARMAEVCGVFEGVHDFRNFCCRGTSVASTVRQVLAAQVFEPSRQQAWSWLLPQPTYCFRVRGRGFLRQMVRLMMGALVKVGRGKCSKSQIVDYLLHPQGDKLGPTAPAGGLYLKEVCYPSPSNS